MKLLSIFLLIFIFTTTVRGQIKDHYLKIEHSDDTLADLKYFKTIDKSITQKLDSFLIYLKLNNINIKKNIGFIRVSLFNDYKGRMGVYIRLCPGYADYRVYSTKDFGNSFAFSFFKSKLILFTLSASKYSLKDSYQFLMQDLLYAEMPTSVKTEIDNNSTEFDIDLPGLVKRYYFN